MTKDHESGSVAEVQLALIGFVIDGKVPSQEILRAFLKADRLNILRGLGDAGLHLALTDQEAIKRLQRLSEVASSQQQKGPFDGQYYDPRTFVEQIPARPPAQVKPKTTGIDEILSMLEESGSLPE